MYKGSGRMGYSLVTRLYFREVQLPIVGLQIQVDSIQ